MLLSVESLHPLCSPSLLPHWLPDPVLRPVGDWVSCGHGTMVIRGGGSGRLTGRVGPVLARGAAGLAEAHVVLGQDPEGVVHVGGELQPRGGAGALHLRQVHPHVGLVEQVLVLDQELWGGPRGRGGETGLEVNTEIFVICSFSFQPMLLNSVPV